MKKYFEYPFNKSIQKKLEKYYENTKLKQHSGQDKKSDLKIDRVMRLTEFKETDIVLDIGCSSGLVLSKIAGYISKEKGVDISESVIKEDQTKNKIDNLTFQTYDGINIPKGESYDKILLLDVLEHTFYPDLLIRNIHNALKRNGELIIEVPFTGWLSELIYGKYHEGHLRYYDPKYLKKYLEGRGFKVKKIKTYNSVPFSSFFLKFPCLWKTMNFICEACPHNLYPYFGEILAIAEKNIKDK